MQTIQPFNHSTIGCTLCLMPTPRRIVLSGEHVVVAEMTLDDQSQFQRWLSENAELRALIDDQRVPTMEDQLKWFARIQQPDRKMFSLVTFPGHELIGNAGFADMDPAEKMALFRITIGSTGHHGKGLGTEATMLVLQYGFDELDLRRIRLEVLPSNARAIRSYEKAGFVAEDGPLVHGKLRMAVDRHSFLDRIT